MNSKESKFWDFKESESLTLKDEDLANYKMKNKFYEDISSLFLNHLKGGIHPCLKCPINQRESSCPSLINFNNCLIDINTFKILFYVLPNSKVTSLKLTTNYLTLEQIDYLVNFLLTKKHNIFNFTYEWNDKITYDRIQYSFSDFDSVLEEKITEVLNKSKELLSSIVSAPSQLEYICFRGNLLGDKTVIDIFEGLKNNTNLIVLNLYKNNISNKSLSAFKEMLTNNKKLEEINLGGNFIGDEIFEIMKGNVGKFKLSSEELEEYNKKSKERQEIINKNIKLKAQKKPELEVPFLDDLVVIDEESYIVKNDTLKEVNLIENKLTEKCFDNMLIVLKEGEKIKISIDYKIFTIKQKNMISTQSGDFTNRIYFLK